MGNMMNKWFAISVPYAWENRSNARIIGDSCASECCDTHASLLKQIDRLERVVKHWRANAKSKGGE